MSVWKVQVVQQLTNNIVAEAPGTFHTTGNISTCENNPKFVIPNRGQQIPFLILLTWNLFTIMHTTSQA